jgi:hypothetical protein
MTEPDDPARLGDTPSAPAGLRDALRAAQADVGSAEQVARLAQRLGPLLGPVGPAVPAAAAGKAVAAKLGLAGVALLIAGGGAWLLSASVSAPPPPAPIPAHASSTSAAEPVVAAPLAAPPASESAPAADENAPTPAAAASPAKLPEKPTPPARPSEAELLEQARAAMKGDPARALQRANEHAARFPRGVLVQEREVLAIQALRQLGRTAEADRRAQAFAKAFPGSAFQRKLR